MKLQQLKYLLAIVDNGLNITAAADRLYTSQPGVSKQLKLLEEELGLQLFSRKGKSLSRLTRAGEQVVVRARTVMEEVEQIRRLAADFYPSLAMDGRRVAFESRRTGTLDVWVKDLVTQRLVRITATDSDRKTAAIHPSGDRVAYREVLSVSDACLLFRRRQRPW